MSRGRICKEYRRNRRGPGIPIKIEFCLRCLQFGHHRYGCRNDPLVSCGSCFRAYFFATECPCHNPQNDQMTLRLIGGQNYPRPCIDIMIGFESYEALINLSKSTTTINLEVLNHINSLRNLTKLPEFTYPGFVEFPIRRRFKQITLQLEIKDDQVDPVILGMDFLMGTGFSLTMDRVSINENSPVIKNSKMVDFLYNLPKGRFLKNWLQKCNRPMYNQYQKGHLPSLQLEPVVCINNYQHEEEELAADKDILDIHTDIEDLNEL